MLNSVNRMCIISKLLFYDIKIKMNDKRPLILFCIKHYRKLYFQHVIRGMIIILLKA